LVFLRSLRRLLVTASVVPSSPILHSYRRENLKSYKKKIIPFITMKTQLSGVLQENSAGYALVALRA
jgi:hypothetical protein